jgi:tetraacyldisaccharide 4'-kinase
MNPDPDEQGFGSLSFGTMLICSSMYKAPSGLAPVLYIPGLGYEAVVRLRNWAYSSNWLRQRKLESPVISIGNITMGGSGKTPLVIYIAQMLLKLGCTPAVLSRGYGRLSSEMQIAPPGMEIENPISELGDEPVLIRRRVPDVWMGISQNRFEAGSRLEQKNKMTFLLDDGFQHRKLFRDLDIVVIDGSQPLESNRIFPRGSLREPLSALRRSNVVVIHGSQDDIARTKTTIKRLGVQAEVLTCEQKITAIIPFADWQKSMEGAALAAVKTAYPVAALGNPERFLKDLSKIGVVWRGKKFFSDHHKLSRQDWKACCEEARRNAADVIILTEKDAIKISDPPDFPLAVAVQSTEMSDARALENILRKACCS